MDGSYGTYGEIKEVHTEFWWGGVRNETTWKTGVKMGG